MAAVSERKVESDVGCCSGSMEEGMPAVIPTDVCTRLSISSKAHSFGGTASNRSILAIRRRYLIKERTVNEWTRVSDHTTTYGRLILQPHDKSKNLHFRSVVASEMDTKLFLWWQPFGSSTFQSMGLVVVLSATSIQRVHRAHPTVLFDSLMCDWASS